MPLLAAAERKRGSLAEQALRLEAAPPRHRPASRGVTVAASGASEGRGPRAGSGRAVAARFTARTRAPGSSGNVTIEISQRSIASSLRMRVFGSSRPLHGAKADREPVGGAGLEQRQQLARPHHLGDQPAARVQPAHILAQLEPDADRLGRIVLEQHRHAAHAALPQRGRERARHHHVARLVELAEQRGVALDRAVGARSWRPARVRCRWVRAWVFLRLRSRRGTSAVTRGR